MNFLGGFLCGIIVTVLGVITWCALSRSHDTDEGDAP